MKQSFFILVLVFGLFTLSANAQPSLGVSPLSSQPQVSHYPTTTQPPATVVPVSRMSNLDQGLYETTYGSILLAGAQPREITITELYNAVKKTERYSFRFDYANGVSLPFDFIFVTINGNPTWSETKFDSAHTLLTGNTNQSNIRFAGLIQAFLNDDHGIKDGVIMLLPTAPLPAAITIEK